MTTEILQSPLTDLESQNLDGLESSLISIADQINAAHRDAESAIQESLERAKQAGELLMLAKSTLPHGEFTGWIVRNCNFSDRMAQQYMRISRRWKDVESKTKRVSDLSLRDAISLLSGNQDYFTSDSVEWYTPKSVVDSVLTVLGEIDLDPCSNSKVEPNVPASQHFTQEDDGLSQDWSGRVFLNPPYGRSIGKWVEKLIDEYNSGNVSEAIALLPARTDTCWSKLLSEFPHCFIRGRLKFSESSGSGKFASVAVYLGRDIDAFVKAFGDHGDVFIKFESQKTTPSNHGRSQGEPCNGCGQLDQLTIFFSKRSGKFYEICDRCESLLGVD